MPHLWALGATTVLLRVGMPPSMVEEFLVYIIHYTVVFSASPMEVEFKGIMHVVLLFMLIYYSSSANVVTFLH